jgi:hypothetical protein
VAKRRTRRIGAIAVAMALLLVATIVLTVIGIMSRHQIREQKLALAE